MGRDAESMTGIIGGRTGTLHMGNDEICRMKKEDV